MPGNCRGLIHPRIAVAVRKRRKAVVSFSARRLLNSPRSEQRSFIKGPRQNVGGQQKPLCAPRRSVCPHSLYHSRNLKNQHQPPPHCTGPCAPPTCSATLLFCCLNPDDSSRPSTPAPASAKAAPAPAAPAPTRGTQKARGGPASRGGRYYPRGGKSSAPRENQNGEGAVEEGAEAPRKRCTSP